MSEVATKQWDLQAGESPLEFRYFTYYRSLLHRSVRQVAADHKVSYNRIQSIASKHRWVERCHAWDLEVSRRTQEAEISEIAKMNARHAGLAMTIHEAVSKELQAYCTLINQADEKARADGKKCHQPLLTPGDIVKLVQTATALERTARGAPPAGQAEDTAQERLECLSLKELKQLQALKKKMADVRR